MSALNVILTCTASKIIPPSRRLSLRSIPRIDTEARFTRWTRNLQSAIADIAASDLYQGDYWRVSRVAVQNWREDKIEVNLRIASAGLGLLRENETIPSYSATFVRSSADSVVHPSRRVEECEKWWQLLTDWRYERGKRLNSIESIARSQPTIPILVVASPPYLSALKRDLYAARECLSYPELLTIVSCGSRPSPENSRNYVDFDSSASQILGGGCATVNGRMLRWISENVPHRDLNCDGVNEKVSSLLKGEIRPRKTVFRDRIDDKSVKAFIRKQKKLNPRISFSAALTDLRSTGKACEYSRFRSIFNSFENEKQA